MRKIAILIPHYKSWKWLPIAVNSFKQYPFSIEHEIIVCDGSPGHPSIRAITETSLGEGVKVVSGDPELPSHGQGLSLAWEQASPGCDWAFTTETDAVALRHGWGEPYIKASVGSDLIGPHMALAGGKFVHPAGAMYSRRLIDAMKDWQKKHADWVFVPSAAITLGLSDRAYHVVCHKNYLDGKNLSADKLKEIEVWSRSGPWQNMIAFDNDSFDDYWLRSQITNWEPTGAQAYLRIGYEPGQNLSGFAHANGFNCVHTPCHIEWMPGRENQQAAYSDIYNGAFRHIWAGTSATVVEGLADEVKTFKTKQMNDYWQTVPADIRREIEKMEASA